MDFWDEITDEAEERLADWNDANSLCEKLGAPKDLSLEAKIRWLLTGKKKEAA